MPTTTPNPAELAASIKSLAAKYAIALKDADLDAQFRAADELEAAIDQLRDLASGPSAGAVKDDRYRQWFDVVMDVNPQYLEQADYALAKPLYEDAGIRLSNRFLEGLNGAATAATPPAEKEVRAAAQTVITARLRFGWSPEVDEAIAVLEKALEGEKEVRVPLSDEQIKDVAHRASKERQLSWSGYESDESGFYTVPSLAPCHYQFARAIERAHGIGIPARVDSEGA